MTGPQLPATRATPERLVQLLVNIASRLERLEGLTDRLAEHVERVERRFDGEQIRVVALNEKVALLTMQIDMVPTRRWVVGLVLSTAGGMLIATAMMAWVLRYWHVAPPV